MIWWSEASERMQYPQIYLLLKTLYFIGLLHFIRCNTHDRRYQIIAPRTYTAFSGKLMLNYTIPHDECLTNAYIALLAIEKTGESEIQTLSVGCNSRSREIACGVVVSAGRYVYRIYSQRHGKVLDEFYFHVLWPKTVLKLPPKQNAFENNITVSIDSKAICKSRIHTHSLHIDLIFWGEVPKSKFIKNIKPVRIASLDIDDISLNTTYEFPCNKTELPGKYHAELRSSKRKGHVPDQIIAKSSNMSITWSDNYNLNIVDRQSLKYYESVTIEFQQPTCSVVTDRIRMYAMHRKVSGSLASPLEAKYCAERFAFRNISSVYFNCSLFDIFEKVVGFCFVYETMTSKGAVREQTKLCVSAKDNAVITVDGNWNKWSSWATCTTTCGRGKQNRFRLCNQPPPSKGGRFCVGEPVEWKDCFVNCTRTTPKTPLKPVKTNGSCVCGCVLSNQTGFITATEECSGLSVWFIKVARHHRITLLFQYANLRSSTQWIKVRDGLATNAKLIAFSEVEGIPDSVTSSSNDMRVEFKTSSSRDSSSSREIQQQLTDDGRIGQSYLYGFVANYTISVINASAAAALVPRSLMVKEPEWENTIVAVGIIICVMTLVASVGCGIYHRFYGQQWHKYTVASQGDNSPYHVKSSAPSSPTSAAGNATIEHDMEAPLTKSVSTKRKKQDSGTPVLASPHTSVSSASSLLGHSRKIETKAEVLSPANLSSPYTTHPIDHGPNSLNSSPSAKNRSPKVHPVDYKKKRKGSSTDKGSNLDLGERIVLGSSGTPSSSQANSNMPLVKSPASITDTSSTKSTKSDMDKVQKRDKSKHFRLPTPKGSNRNSDGIPLMTLQEKSDYDLKTLSRSSSREDSMHSGKNTTTAFVGGDSKPKRPTSLVKEDHNLPFKKASPMAAKKKPPLDYSPRLLDSQRISKPDGQSPELLRGDKTPRSMTPLSVRSLKTLSPTRSILTSSDATSEGCELEYDDFIMDDPFSYFDTEDTLKLRWQGTEKIGTLKPSDSTLTFD
ncbi:Hypothetical predicted protein [Octopus vulgaris]|uniref:CUB domain-containing protein n=1 Tax=Octopus vulgaris TaxID=6645 RepID=A0AA36BCX1_OCTVU|nr:Hypothetical predicted protein [Octopus vulgaris]